jgi:glycerate dehydrogenase
MQIVVLDGHTLNPGDLDWAPLQALGTCTIHDRTAPTDVVARAAAAEVVLTNKVVLSREVLAQLPRLRYVGVLATGYNVVDTAAARERGVPVTNVPAYSTASVAQLVFAHLLHLANNVAGHDAAVHRGRWSTNPDFCFWLTPQVELAGLTLGIVGYGQIGQAVAAIGRALGMTILSSTRTPRPASPEVTWVELDELFRRSDAVTLHCPLTADTKHLVNARRLALMKPTAWLINTGRGPLVDEAALAAALHAGQLAGAAVDVVSTEPPPATNPLLGAPRCVFTPHLAWATQAARRRLLATVIANLAAWQRGAPQNVVN